jgi:hypothetical protein
MAGSNPEIPGTVVPRQPKILTTSAFLREMVKSTKFIFFDAEAFLVIALTPTLLFLK